MGQTWIIKHKAKEEADHVGKLQGTWTGFEQKTNSAAVRQAEETRQQGPEANEDYERLAEEEKQKREKAALHAKHQEEAEEEEEERQNRKNELQRKRQEAEKGQEREKAKLETQPPVEEASLRIAKELTAERQAEAERQNREN